MGILMRKYSLFSIVLSFLAVNVLASNEFDGTETNSVIERTLYSLKNAKITVLSHSIDDQGIQSNQRGQGITKERDDHVQTFFGVFGIDPILTNIGEKFWNLITGNERPHSVDWDKIKAHALPEGVSSPVELFPWNAELKSESFDVLIENFIGTDLFHMETTVSYNFGAPHKGVGQHIANVTVMPRDANAFFGFRGDASVRVLDPLYDSKHVAMLPIVIELKVTGPFDTIVRSERFDLRGDGEIARVGEYH